MDLASPKTFALAAEHLRAHDPKLRSIIETAGLCTITPHTDYYGALVNSIIGQQLSVKAAAAIKARFFALFDDSLPTPEQILKKSIEELRSAGLSNAKARYILDLAEHVHDKKVRFDKIQTQSNDTIIVELTDIKGVGEWTAHMFLMFCVGRLDVLPTGDLGIKNAVRKLYGFKDAPTPDEIKDVAKKYHWHPYESVASWYLWRTLDNEPAVALEN